MAKNELVEVNLQLAAAHAVVRADEPLLKVTDGPVGQWNFRFRALAQVASHRLVRGICLKPASCNSGLAEMPGHEIPSPEAARNFLYEFHSEASIETAKQQRGLGEAYIPGENAALSGLGYVNRDLVREVGRRCPEQKIATIDQDATIIGSRKQEALRTYEGERGYQPMLAVWAEMNLVLADEFRDGNVPAAHEGLTVVKAAFEALPPTVREFYYRGDSACHEHGLVDWLRNEKREEGPHGFIGFANQRAHESGGADGG